MIYDYKKEFKEYYSPSLTPAIVTIPAMNFVAVRGKGDPNEQNGAYQRALEQLYAISYTIKMSERGGWTIPRYFAYVVPPLEGLWKQEGGVMDYAHKERFEWISMIRLPDFVTESVFRRAVQESERKKGKDFSAAEFFSYEEGLCVQCMHAGSYDNEPTTIAAMDRYAQESGYRIDIGQDRLHHEIYLSDPRKCAAEKLRTVLRHPVKAV